MEQAARASLDTALHCKGAIWGHQKKVTQLLEAGLWSSVCGIWKGILNRSSKEKAKKALSILVREA